MDTLAIVKRIEMRISELGMAKADFYKSSGISSASFSQWKTGVYKPSEKKLRCAAECLNMSYEYLAYGINEQKEKAPTETSERKTDILDEVDVAFYGDYKELTEENKETLRAMARLFRERQGKQE